MRGERQEMRGEREGRGEEVTREWGEGKDGREEKNRDEERDEMRKE